MKPVVRIVLPILFGCLLPGCDKTPKAVATVAGVPDGAPVSFNTSIQPILSENCYHCHGPDSNKREPKRNR